MPAPERNARHQWAVLWPADGVDSFGQFTVSLANRQEIKVRWNNDQREVLIPNQGNVVVDATLVVDQDIPMGSIVWQGRLKDISDPNRVPLSDLFQVKTASKTPDLKGRVFRREVTLMRFNNSLPLSS